MQQTLHDAQADERIPRGLLARMQEAWTPGLDYARQASAAGPARPRGRAAGP
jgi:hypothetical protein